MPKPFDIEKFNRILKKHNQELRAVKITGKVIELSNNKKITEGTEVERCKKRIMRGHDSWKDNFDLIYGLDPDAASQTEQKARSATSRKGGINCQKIHGDRLCKENLTGTGIPFTKGHRSWNIGLTKDNNASLKMLSENRKGSGNPMYGTVMSDNDKERRSVLMKQMILDGKFTPNSNNRNTHWDSEFNGKKYRSSWEALYAAHDPDAEYEALRIPYIFNNERFIYIVDFVNHNHKIAVEVKPVEMMSASKTVAKIDALIEWCDEKEYTFLLVDAKYLRSLVPPDLSLFDNNTKDKIRKLYEIN